jgi:MYXO-CTERM domain-containing protein
MRRILSAGLVVAAAAFAVDAGAFCGFYVSGAGAQLTNNATQVVLMRDGTRTVLSMQNNYQGPPQDFAMVIPVPVVLQKENVKTLDRAVFDHVDALTAPRLVEYWEQDPCPRPMPGGLADLRGAMPMSAAAGAGAAVPAPAPPPVKIEAQFSVGEYDIVVLSATDSTALDTWLHQNGYKIPDGAAPYLRPYVEMGFKFFVAKVDVSKVRFERIGNGPEMAMLSPLRFHYDSDAFNLPIRLGLINSGGTQDLVVNILARNQRYEVANYDNVAIPTNIDVSNATRGEFGAFYATLFDQTLAKHPRSVITEYSWGSNSCDPCPTPPLDTSDLATLGADVLPSLAPPQPPGVGAPIVAPRVPRYLMNGFVVTRLHARYSKDALGDDLFFRAAPPIVGGREFVRDGGKLEQGAQPDSQNNFQARYAIRHPWTGPIACAHPQRGMWGGPPSGPMMAAGGPGVTPAKRLGLAARNPSLQLAAFVRGAVPPESMLGRGGATPVLSFPPTTSSPVDAGPDLDAAIVDSGSLDLGLDAAVAPALPPTAPPSGGCAGCSSTPGDATTGGALLALLGVALTRLRRRRG